MTESNPQNRRLGYARVSTYGQTLDAQLAQLRADGCARIYREKASGAQPTRRELLRMLKALAPGDMVTVTRIDRLARSTLDLFAIVKQIVDAGGQFRSLAEPWADTATSTGRLMIAVLGGLADVERDLIRTGTAEGRSRAKARGQHMGRPPRLTPQQQAEARRRRAEDATLKELARSYNVGRATIPRLATCAKKQRTRNMELGNFGKHTILTGAGWSHNWGARLAADVWQLLMDNPAIAASESLRALLLEEQSFEVALAKTHEPPFTTNERASFEQAVIEAFVSIDRAMMPDHDPSTWINIYNVQKLLFRFAGRRDQGGNTGYIFTLNQDLFFERYLYNHLSNSAPAPVLPGIQVTPGLSIFPTTGAHSEHFTMRPFVDPVAQVTLCGRLNVIKLHGSFNWRTPDARNVMVVGTEKTRQIANLPLLSWYLDIFQAALFSGAIRLMIVGYGFGDEHVNATIAEAIENHGLKVFIWGRGSNLKDRILAAPHGSTIWKGLLSTVTQPMIEVFPSSQAITEEYRRIRRVFFEDQTIW